MSKRVLVLGCTGNLGYKICKRLAVSDFEFVCGIVRPQSAQSTQAIDLAKSGLRIVAGDITDVGFVTQVLVEHKIDTVLGALRSSDTNKIEQCLLEACKTVGTVKRFIPSSFGCHSLIIPPTEYYMRVSESCKRLEQTMESGIGYTLIFTSIFMDWGFSSDFGFDTNSCSVTLPGDGNFKFSVTHTDDIAWALPFILKDPSTINQKVFISSATLSFNESVKIFEEVTKKPWTCRYLNASELQEQKEQLIKDAKKEEAFVMDYKRCMLTQQSAFLFAPENSFKISRTTSLRDYISANLAKDRDPQKSSWGCHFHIDTDTNLLGKGIHLKNAFMEYLKQKDITITRAGSYKSTYGPHSLCNSEIRLESYQTQKDKLPVSFVTPRCHFKELAVAALFASTNTHGMFLAVHPLSHNDFSFDMETEGDDHKFRGIFFNGASPWDNNFFYSPPLIKISQDNPESIRLVTMGLPQKDGFVLKDTRTPALMSVTEIETALQQHSELQIAIPKNLLKATFVATPILIERLAAYIGTLNTSTTIESQSVNGNQATMKLKNNHQNEFLEVAGLGACWLMFNRHMSENAEIIFQIELMNGEVLERCGALLNLST